NAFDRRYGWSHAGLGVEAVGSAAAAGVALLAVGLALRCVLFPIARSYIFIRSRHFNAAVSRDRGCFSRRRRNDRIRPEQLLFDVEIHLLDVRWRRVVAAVQPHDHAGMAAQAVDLVAQRLLCDFKILGLPARPTL